MKTTHQPTSKNSSLKKPFTVSLLALLGLILSAPLQAGGSVSFGEIKRILPPVVRSHLENSFNIADTGIGTRLGRHFIHLAGKRMGPYEFMAASKANPDTAFQITIKTKAMFLNRFGHQNHNAEDAVALDEAFDSYNTKIVNTDDHTWQGPPLPLNKNPQEVEVENVRRIYNEIQSYNLPMQRSGFESDEGFRGTIAVGKVRGDTVRKLTLNVVTDDHSGFEAEIYYDANQMPAFVVWTDRHWGFNPKSHNQAIDYVEEYRFYYSPEGELVKALEKCYQGANDWEVSEARDRAANREITGHEPGVFEFRKNAANLALPGRTANPGRTIEDLQSFKNALINGL